MASRFLVGELLTRGAQGRVYRAIDKISGQSCILKAGDTAHEEARRVLEINHPFLARPFDCGIDAQIGKFSAYPEFKNLSFLEWMRSKPSDLEIRRIAMQLAEFLSFLHNRGWLYNDFKPEHFLIGPLHLTVLDVGLCSGLEQKSHSYSGTFPYISPERMTGREVDARSDIFAAGILLLHGFFPDEEWNEEPSINALQKIQSECGKLKGFWKKVISEMTAFEPGQRTGSAGELWKRLRPEQHDNLFLFFTPSPHFSLNSPCENTAVHSGSSMMLKDAMRQAQIDAWRSNQQTIELDFRNQSVQNAFQNLARALTENDTNNFYISLETLRNLSGTHRYLIILRNVEGLKDQDLCLLQFAIASLTSQSAFRFFLPLTRKKGLIELDHDNWTQIELPSITKENRDIVLQNLFPAENRTGARAQDYLKTNPSTPEQIVWNIRRDLENSDSQFWPSAAFSAGAVKTIDSLNAAQKKLLTFVALGGGKVCRSLLFSVLKKDSMQASDLLFALQADGFLYEDAEAIHLNVPVDSLLSRLRKGQIREMARRMLKIWGSAILQDRLMTFEVAKHAGDHRLAALFALKLSRAAREKGNREESRRWLVNSFLCGAKIPRRCLHRMAIYEMRRAQMQNVRKILAQIKKRFGNSYRLIDLWLDYFRRRGNITSGLRLAKMTINRSRKRGHQDAENYFLARLVTLLLVHQKIQEADEVLAVLKKRELKTSTSALINIQCGISDFYHGRMPQALRLLHIAYRSKHPFRSLALLALGPTYGRMGSYEQALRWSYRAVRFFEKQQDAHFLSVAYTTLGTMLRRCQKISQAREFYRRSLSLSHITGNTRNYVTCLDSLANSYQEEGRTDRAIEYYKKTIHLSYKAGLAFYLGISLTNLGLQYAVKGEFKKAYHAVRRAIQVRRKLNVPINLALSYEYLGTCYFLSGRPTTALRYFKIAGDIFQKSHCATEHRRIEIFCAICLVKKGQQQQANEILSRTFNINENSLEKGLYHFAVASAELASNNWNSAVCRQSLHESERVFRKLPYILWLAQVYHLKVQYAYRTDHYEKALLFLETAFNLFSRLGANRDLLKLEKWGQKIKMPADFMDKMAEKLPYKVLVMLKKVLASKDPDSMISEILTTALEFTDMDRAVLILHEEPRRIFKSVAIEQSAVNEICEISKSATESVSESGKPFVCLDASADPYIKSKPSIVSNRIMSIICLPLKAQEKTIGMLYLDSKEGVESLTKTERLLLEIFASIIALALNRAIDLEKSIDENKFLRDTTEWRKIFPEIIGKSKAVTDIFKTLNRLLDNELPVLVYGETGTGKELIARVLHFCGKRKNGNFIAVNCSAFSKELMESELFGHEKGAFTGAANLKRGLFEEAQNGTLFLDEISELPFSMQAKLLRVLQGGEFRRVGGTQTLRSNARIVLATNRDLAQMVKDKEFRDDLYYRIRGVQVHIPPLRQRKEDIPLLANEFLKESMRTTRKNIQGFTPDTLSVLKDYDWPGNVRQLKLEIEKIVALTENEWISVDDLDQQIRESNFHELKEAGNGSDSLQEMERAIILERLQKYEGNVIQAAKSLGISRHGLYSKMRRYQIQLQSK